MTAHGVNGELGGYPAVHPRGRPHPGRQGAEPPAETGLPAEDPLHLGPAEGVLPRRGVPPRNRPQPGRTWGAMPLPGALPRPRPPRGLPLLGGFVPAGRIIGPVAEHRSPGRHVRQELQGHLRLGGVHGRQFPGENGVVFIHQSMQAIPTRKAAVDPPGPGGVVLAARPNRQGPRVQPTPASGRGLGGEGSKHTRQPIGEPGTANTAVELRDRGPLPRPEQAAVTVASAGPTLRSVVPDRPEQHGRDQRVGVGKTPPRAGQSRCLALDDRVQCSFSILGCSR